MDVDNNHWGEHVMDTSKVEKGTILITGPIMGNPNVEFGRLVQVRKKSGAYGSDTVLLRSYDGTLKSYHNMSFFKVREQYTKMFEGFMYEVDIQNVDKEDQSYTIEGKNEAVGFIVEGLNDIEGESYGFSMIITKN